MIRINLLPYREKEKKEDITRQILIVAISFVVFLLVIGGLHFYVDMKISSLNDEIKELEGRLATLTRIVGHIEGYKRDKIIVEKKLAIINTLEENRLAPVLMLDEMTTLVPVKDVWLEKLTEKGPELVIEGVARNNIAVALFMKNLAGATFLKSVDLISTKEKEISGIKLQQFVISCMKKG